MLNVRPHSIKIAREYRNLKQVELSKKVGFSSTAKLSKIESGLTKIKEEEFDILRKALGFPEEFFSNDFSSEVKNEFKYRTRKVSASIKSEVEANIHIVLHIIDKLIKESFELITFDFEDFINNPLINGLEVEEIAMKMRSHLSIDRINEENLISKIEELGIIVLEVEYSKYEDSKNLKIDGTSAITKSGIPVIFISKHFPPSRKKFTLAHELGHVILHLFRYSNRLSEKKMEEEANRFASEFLLPTKTVKRELRELNIQKLKTLKTYFGASMGAILYKSRSLNLITENQYKNIIIEMSRKKILRNEPLEMTIKIDKPMILRRILNHYSDELGYTDEDLATMSNLFVKDYRKLKWLFFNTQDNIMRLI